MKILKPGKVEIGKFVCPTCACEFIATENEVEWYTSTTVEVNCPQGGCRKHFRVDWELYEEPTTTQSDRERLREAIKKWLLDPDAKSADELVDRLIAHGVTFKENT